MPTVIIHMIGEGNRKTTKHVKADQAEYFGRVLKQTNRMANELGLKVTLVRVK